MFDFSKYVEINGKWTYVGPRVKSGVEYATQLSDECMEIVKKYDMALPKISNFDYNKFLKALAMAAGIEKRMHTHLARHTFATRMLSSHVCIENVQKMLGHKNISQTLRYAKVLPQSVFEEFTRVEDEKKKRQ